MWENRRCQPAPPPTRKSASPLSEKEGTNMASPAIDIIRKKVPQEIGGNAFLKKAPQERTRSIKVLLVASVSAGVHLVLGILLAPLFTVAFLAANTPSHPIIFRNIQ